MRMVVHSKERRKKTNYDENMIILKIAGSDYGWSGKNNLDIKIPISMLITAIYIQLR